MNILYIGTIFNVINGIIEGELRWSELASALEMPLKTLEALFRATGIIEGNGELAREIEYQDIVNVICLFYAMKQTVLFTKTVFAPPPRASQA